MDTDTANNILIAILSLQVIYYLVSLFTLFRYGCMFTYPLHMTYSISQRNETNINKLTKNQIQNNKEITRLLSIIHKNILTPQDRQSLKQRNGKQILLEQGEEL